MQTALNLRTARLARKEEIRMKMQLSEVARALGIESEDQYDQITITSVSFDSRSLEQGALFVPLIASNDGHEFVKLLSKMVPVPHYGRKIMKTVRKEFRC